MNACCDRQHLGKRILPGILFNGVFSDVSGDLQVFICLDSMGVEMFVFCRFQIVFYTITLCKKLHNDAKVYKRRARKE
jgi:hypothetical protein